MGPRVSETSAPPAPPASRRSPRSPVLPGKAIRGSGKPGAARSALSVTTRRVERSDRDIRRKRPPALSFLLRTSTIWRVTRVATLLALDFAGVALADVHRARAQGSGPRPRAGRALARNHRTLPAVRVPAHRAAVRALRAVRAARAAPRPLAHRRLAVPGRVRRADLRRRQRRTLLQLLPLLEHARVRDPLHRRRARRVRARHRVAAARRRLPAPRRARRQRQTHRRRRARARRHAAHADRRRRLPLLQAHPRQRPARARLAREPRATCSTPRASTRSSSPTPSSPRTTPSSWSTNATSAASACASRPRRWRS